MPQNYEKTALVVLRRAVFYEVLRKTLCHSRLFQPLSAPFASVLGALGNHNKDKGTAKLEDYKNVSCSFNIGTAELQDATNWTDFPSDGRMFSYFINLNFGGSSCLQFLFNERTGTGIGIYFRNYNAGSYEMKPWRKVEVTT